MARRIQIAVLGGRDVTDDLLAMAEEVGRRIAEKGAVLITGGLMGVMEAASRGAHQAGGLVAGVLPMTDPGAANPYVDVAIATGLGVARNAVILHSADGAIAVGGRYGTLSEMAYALQLGVPLVSLHSWPVDETVTKAATPQEAVERLWALMDPEKRSRR